MKRPIGVFDSGVGGLSVLKEAIKRLPNEDFVYFGDSANSPYGTKTAECVERLAVNAAERLLSYHIKALVIACNTATAAAAGLLRKKYVFPIIGMEPAIKPASSLRDKGKIIVLATPLTLKLPKFNDLLAQYGEGVIPVPCPGLMEYIEEGLLEGDLIDAYLANIISKCGSYVIDAVVLGCTHYIFLRPALRKALRLNTPIIDGNEGTIRQLCKRLEETGNIYRGDDRGHVLLTTSAKEQKVMPIMERLMRVNV